MSAPPTPTPPAVFVRVKSHRAGHKLKRAIGKLDWHHTFKDGGVFVKLLPEQLPVALAITGIVRAKGTNYAQCWSFV